MKKVILFSCAVIFSFPAYSRLCVEVSPDSNFQQLQSDNHATADIEVQFHLSKKEGRQFIPLEGADSRIILSAEGSKKTCVKTEENKRKTEDMKINVRATLNVRMADGKGYGRKCSHSAGILDNDYLPRDLAKKQLLLVTLSTVKKRNNSSSDLEAGKTVESCSISFR